MTLPLPYPGHTWFFTQHAVGIEPYTLYKMLEAASMFVGGLDFGKSLTEIMVKEGVLTPNERDGKDDAWRDYQQILAELGLIYSTRVSRKLAITKLGYSYLSGDIGFSELITLQALRYQYPNGQKSTIQSGLKSDLSNNGFKVPDTLITLQLDQGVLFRPTVLVLRILIELNKKGFSPELSTDEIQHFLIPVKRQDEWERCVAVIIKNRLGTEKLDINKFRHSRRNVQDWMKFLSKSDLFQLDNNKILRLKSLDPLFILSCEEIVNVYENKDFWVPSDTSIETRKTWFDFYGNIPDEELIFGEHTEEYVKANYINGLEGDEDVVDSNFTVRLKEFESLDLSNISNLEDIIKSPQELQKLLNNLQKGIQKRKAKHILHEQIVDKLSSKFITQGAKVQLDPSSVDIYAHWPDGNTAMFEVKTILPRNLQSRLRLAIGQILEYDYRFKQEKIPCDDKIIVINQKIMKSNWNVDFLTNHLDLGLICTSDIFHESFCSKSSKSHEYW
ncbi:hypothetical protein RFH42_16685 [Acinetobacter rudis]|uniref:hypothetical protein n=2 Tax=Acinetobacter TaxID=469 RepID=UPI00280C9598|nr:hypothetical protein [Acinetobacter rudis]MDQ8954588.1 hypothetical protein [Acinetobacter rudis]